MIMFTFKLHKIQ